MVNPGEISIAAAITPPDYLMHHVKVGYTLALD